MHNYTMDSVSEMIFTGATNAIYSKSEASNATYRLLMGNTISELGEISVESLDGIDAVDEKKIEKVLLKTGDVALLSRGSSMRAGIITKEIAVMNVVPSASFIIIRPNPKAFLGEVLVAYLNSSVGQSALAQLTKGTTLQSLATSDFKKMSIHLPSMDKQKEMVELFYASNEAYKNGKDFIEQQRLTAIATMLTIMLGAKP